MGTADTEPIEDYTRRRLYEMLTEHNRKHLDGDHPPLTLDELMALEAEYNPYGFDH